jgi:trk system potassium uptake protein TrkH
MKKVRRLDRFREVVNLSIYDSKQTVLSILRILRLVVSLFALAGAVYYFGFPVPKEQIPLIIMTIRGVFVFFMVSYFIRFFFDFEPRKFIKDNLIETVLLSLVLLDVLGVLLFGTPLLRHFFDAYEIPVFSEIFLLIILGFLLIIVFLELVKVGKYLHRTGVSAASMFVISFIFLILLGTGLLMMPETNTKGEIMPFMDALFTSTSASCVTGLTVVDTATYFTLKGQFILLVLMQLGGLNVITFASFFTFFSQKGVGLRQQAIVMDFMSFENLASTKNMLRIILIMAFSIELGGAILLYFLWHPEIYFHGVAQKIFYSIFHSVSAFNNAGFALFTNNLWEPFLRDSYVFHLIIAALIVLGGLGFPVLHDLFSIKNMRERLAKPWKQYKPSTKIVLYTSAFLILSGTIAFYFLETANPLQTAEGGMAQKSATEKVITSLFQSVSTRTAGFNTVDFSILTAPVLIFFIFLMVVGASPASTGGGIKTTTFATILISALSTIRGKKDATVFRHTIPEETIKKAGAIFIFSFSVIFTGAFILHITDPEITPLKLFFEEVSAFCTVGLSTGITAQLSDAGKAVLIVSMFIGRVGTLTLAVSLSKKAISNNYKYPNAFVPVG